MERIASYLPEVQDAYIFEFQIFWGGRVLPSCMEMGFNEAELIDLWSGQCEGIFGSIFT